MVLQRLRWLLIRLMWMLWIGRLESRLRVFCMGWAGSLCCRFCFRRLEQFWCSAWNITCGLAHGFGELSGGTLNEARTTAFVQAAMFELLVVWNCRSEKRSVWRMGKAAFKNKFFVIAEIVSMALTIGITYIPITQQLFHLYGVELERFGLRYSCVCFGVVCVARVHDESGSCGSGSSPIEKLNTLKLAKQQTLTTKGVKCMSEKLANPAPLGLLGLRNDYCFAEFA